MSTNADDERNRRKPGDTTTGSNNNPACDQCRTRKIRCDRESPSCSNCRKANLPCDFTNKGKRINHTKQLVEDFSFLSGRLESIDASIAKITQRLDLDSLSRPNSPGPNGDSAAQPNDDLNHFTRHSSPIGSIEATEPAPFRPGMSGRSNFYISRDQYGAEVYHGPTAGRSLFQQTRLFVSELLDPVKNESDANVSEEIRRLKSAVSSNPIAKTELRKINEIFPFSTTSPDIQTNHDGRHVSRPPQSFVESSLDFFMEEVNTVLPLFDEEHLRSVVKEQYNSQRNSTTEAWNLCFNNIIVLVMGIKLKTALSMNMRRPDLEDDIFMPFLSNSYRAFNNLGDYTLPRLVNIQALITLALVAANHFPYGVFESLIHKACALGREMGLERYVDATCPTSNAVTIERRRVFWSLYVLDKRRTFLTGKPCDLYLAESDLETPKFVHNEMWAKNALARIHMMSIWEEIWKNLYSSRAMRNSAKFREDQINRLRSYLKSWVTHHKTILERPEQVELGNATCMRLELRYSFHVAQILVHRCLDKPDNLQQQVNNARAALKIIKDISQGPSTISGISLLGRLYRSYPILPFYEVHRRTMQHTDDESKEDMELLQACIDALNIFKDPSQPHIYFNKLGAGLEWCMKIANIIRKVQERPSSATPMSRSASATKLIGSPLSRKSTGGKRDAESVDDDSPTNIDARSQKRRVTMPDTSAISQASMISGTHTTDTSQSGSIGPDTPTSGYFSDLNSIDPFGVDQKLSTFPMSQLTSPNEMSDLGMPSTSMGLPSLSGTPVPDSKDQFGMNYAFNYPTPAGTINPARAASTQAATQSVSSSVSPRNNSVDLSSIVSRLPPGSQQALASFPPQSTSNFTPDSYSAFNTNLLDDSFTNVGHHPDIQVNQAADFSSHFDFNFAPDQIGFGPLDSIMNMNGV